MSRKKLITRITRNAALIIEFRGALERNPDAPDRVWLSVGAQLDELKADTLACAEELARLAAGE